MVDVVLGWGSSRYSSNPVYSRFEKQVMSMTNEIFANVWLVVIKTNNAFFTWVVTSNEDSIPASPAINYARERMLKEDLRKVEWVRAAPLDTIPEQPWDRGVK